MAKKVVLIVLGAVALVAGLAAVTGGGLLAAIVGSDDTVHSGAHQMGTPTTALVSPTERVSRANPLRTGIGAVTVTMTAHSTDPVFLGVARAEDVDRYLDQVAYDEVTDFSVSPYRMQTMRHDGSRTPDPPTEQSFWVASATGTDANLQWTVAGGGDYRLVVLNADASLGISTRSEFGVKIGGLFGIAVAVLLLGLLGTVIGAVLLIWGIRTPAADPRPVPAAPYRPGA